MMILSRTCTISPYWYIISNIWISSIKFFNPIFNIADVSISVGVISILLFQRSFFSNDPSKIKEKNPSEEILAKAEMIPGEVESENIQQSTRSINEETENSGDDDSSTPEDKS